MSIDFDFNEVVGMERAKRALEIAAAGGHNILMVGPNGSGRTMLARRLTTILPEISAGEDRQITEIYNAVNLPHRMTGRPFRSPHHTISEPGLVGVVRDGELKPGEIHLAKHGVLFLDELPEFRPHVQDSCANHVGADILVVGAMATCPCGHRGTMRCRCSANMVIGYHRSVTERMLNRFDMRIEVEQADLALANRGDSSETIRERVSKARDLQIERQGVLNAHVDSLYGEYHTSWDTAKQVESVVQQKGLDRRAQDRVLRVARTIADLAGAKNLAQEHFNEALRYV